MNSNDALFYTLFIVFFILFTLRYFGVHKYLRQTIISKEKKAILTKFYSKHIYYFNQLTEIEKDKFVKRAYRLIHFVKIAGRMGFTITTEVKLIVIAAYVQITFGYKYYFLTRFNTILVYPDMYQNKLTGQMHYGEVNPKGLIVLSWQRLLKGHQVIDDAINLGLHEMAHALMHTIIHSNDHERGLDSFLQNIVALSRNEMEKIKSDEHHLFRNYAGTNIFEFFAVAVEYFFEVPEEFKRELPKLYQFMVLLLKQDPAGKVFTK